jgi:hypothetical protein
MLNGLRSVDVLDLPLPTRAEKRFVPITADFPLAQEADFFLTVNSPGKYEYLLFRLPGRGATPTTSAYYKFIINPSQISISKQTMDAQAYTKGGWQIGVMGEDFTQISMQGKTPGKYFSNGLTDLYSEYTLSYRNLTNLEMLFENNGFWFEGEQVQEGPLAPDYQRRRIKMHQDIELTVGEFVWTGMFDTFSVTQSADSPFTAEFSLSFFAWKERFRGNTPYLDSILNDVQKGHTTSVIAIQASLANAGVSTAGKALPPGSSQVLSSDTTVSPTAVPLNDVLNPSSGTFAA